MAKPRVTEWIPGDVAPERVGAYQTAEDEEEAKLPERLIGYQFWTGTHWGMWDSDAAGAEECGDIETSLDVAFWRGLAEASPPQPSTDTASGRAQRTNNKESGNG